MESFAENSWVIVGLGNPGKEYERTRHNLGFMLIDKLAEELNVQVRRDECRSLIGQTLVRDTRVELVKPQTYMNLSGEAVSCLLKKEGRSTDRLVVISDDLALPFGSIRIRPKGSHGGQNGLRSIIDCLKTNEFTRLRIGIQPEHPISNATNFVLEKFSKSEFEIVEKILEESAEAIHTIINDGTEFAMSRFNGEIAVSE
jgi:peptidyl-tRNA hydrolase, PTH1 family